MLNFKAREWLGLGASCSGPLLVKSFKVFLTQSTRHIINGPPELAPKDSL